MSSHRERRCCWRGCARCRSLPTASSSRGRRSTPASPSAISAGTASGFRVRFRLPEGLTYLVGTANIDGTPIDEAGGLTSLLQNAGADIGEIPAGGERRIGLSYTVASTIENGTPIAIQAALSSFEVPVIGSNVVHLVVRSRPVLKNAKTKLTAEPVHGTVPGGELQLKAEVHNSGESSAHSVMVLLPVPANTTYVPETARVDGRSPAGLSETDPFGFGRPAAVVTVLGPGDRSQASRLPRQTKSGFFRV